MFMDCNTQINLVYIVYWGFYGDTIFHPRVQWGYAQLHSGQVPSWAPPWVVFSASLLVFVAPTPIRVPWNYEEL